MKLIFTILILLLFLTSFRKHEIQNKTTTTTQLIRVDNKHNLNSAYDKKNEHLFYKIKACKNLNIDANGFTFIIDGYTWSLDKINFILININSVSYEANWPVENKMNINSKSVKGEVPFVGFSKNDTIYISIGIKGGKPYEDDVKIYPAFIGKIEVE